MVNPDFLHPLLRRYCEQNSSEASDLLKNVERSTFLNTPKPTDASDFLQGRLLSLISALMRPNLIVEIGTFTAYATIALAEGLADGGKIITIESNQALSPLHKRHLCDAGLLSRVDIWYGKALDLVGMLPDKIDMLFIDAAKKEYKYYYEALLDKIKKGGLIIADNVLWKGKVLDPDGDSIALALDEFNKMVARDDRVEMFILPYRDGLSFIRKK